jgi:carboxylate-amine ligase
MPTDVRSTPATVPDWAVWSPDAAAAPFTVGVEEEVMLLDPGTWAPASRIEEVLASLSAPVAGQASAETHGAALELATRPHRDVGAAVAELAGLRERLQADLRRMGLAAAASGTHPSATWADVEISPGARQQSVYDSMRELARREPTFALHVHVAVPGPEEALRALTALRSDLPVLLALSANSPFWQGRDSGLASARIPVFGAFPRVGIPRRFADYRSYVAAIDVLLRCDAFPEPTFLWWDVRLQPRLGTVEVRIMDAQTRAADNAPLVALVQCLVRRGARGVGRPRADAPEVIDENRFLAARDGMRAELIDLGVERRRAVRDRLDELLEACAPHAAELGCGAALDAVPALASRPGAERQRALAAAQPGETTAERLAGLTAALHAEFT